MARSILAGALLAPLLMAGIIFTSCGSESQSERDSVATAKVSTPVLPASSRMRMRNGYGSARELANAALNAFASSDTAELMKLLVSAEEFDRHLYPELGMHYPAARDTSSLARGFVWENHFMGALKGMKKALRALGGKPMTLVAVTFKEGTESYASYRIHQGMEVKVKLSDGAEADLLALGSVVEMDGVFKLLSYRDQE